MAIMNPLIKPSTPVLSRSFSGVQSPRHVEIEPWENDAKFEVEFPTAPTVTCQPNRSSLVNPLIASTVRDLMKCVEPEDLELLNNRRIQGMSKIDWGKSMAVSNQYIQRNLLRNIFPTCHVYTTDDKDLPKVDTANNSPGWDVLVVKPDESTIRIQSKLRQVEGLTDVSQQTHFETTRRNSEKNKDKNSTGHIAYGLDEFDMALVSLVNVKKSMDRRSDINHWSFSLVPITAIQNHACVDTPQCLTHIPSKTLTEYQIDFKVPKTSVTDLKR